MILEIGLEDLSDLETASARRRVLTPQAACLHGSTQTSWVRLLRAAP